MATDFELLDAWIGGDQAAARALFDRYLPALYRFFHGKLDENIDDAVQETLLACVSSRDRFRRQSSFRTYLFGVARNVLWRQLERLRRAPAAFDPERSSLHELAPSPTSVAARKAEHRMLLEALRRLPLELQILLELYHLQELTAIELADLYGVTEVALRGRLHRAKDRLRQEIERMPGPPELLDSTWTNLETWAEQLRALPRDQTPS